MTPRRRFAALLAVLAGLTLTVQSAQATIDPTVDMSPPSPYPFGNVPVGAHKTTTVTMSNPGPEDEVFAAAPGLAGTNPDEFSITNNTCTGTIVSGDSCHFDVTFSPTIAGAASALVQFSAAPVIADYQVSGTGTQAQLTFVPSAGLSFAIGIGDTTAPQSLSITNSGNDTMNISGITIGGTDAARFTKSSDTCGSTLAGGASCTVSVTFTPNAAGVFNATVHVTDDAPNAPHDANLTGTATIPGVQTTPTSLSFPSQQDGTLGATMQVTVKNTSGSASLKIGTLSIGGTNRGSFVIGSDGCSTTAVAPGGTCSVRVTFRPQLIGAKSAALQIPSNAAATANVALLGTSSAPRRVKTVHGASGCTKAHITWTLPTPVPSRYVKVLIVRNRAHVPQTPKDGTALRHGRGVLNDTGLQVTSAYHYSLFTVTNAFNKPARLIYARPTSITVVPGRVCRPMNNGKTSDLTPLIDWVAYGTGSSYSIRLVNSAGRTILVRYTRAGTTQYQVPSRWRYGGSSHRLVHRTTYTVYVYAYNSQHVVGRWIGTSRWRES
jgi:hypothetical protein